MSNFYTDLDRMRSSAQDLNKVGAQVARTEIELTLLNLEMLFFSTEAGRAVRKNINTVKKNIHTCYDGLYKLSSFLNDIAELYRLAEERNMYEQQNKALGDRKNVSAQDKRSYVEEYEKNHPEEVKELKEFLKTGDPNNMTEEDLLNIKYLVYTAPAPFGLIYLKSMGNYTIGTTDKSGAYYSPGNRTINLNYPKSFQDDPRGPYTTFFHESGHGIDDTSDLCSKGGSDTDNFTAYSPAMGKRVTIREAVEYDVYYNKDNPHSMTSIAEDIKARGGSGKNGNIDNVIEAMKNGSPDGLNAKDRALYNAVKNEFNNSTPNTEAYEAVSDVYGGMSGNELRNGYGHDKGYWNNESQINHELWAEYYSYNMAGDTENLNNLNEYFPEASRVLEQYAYALARS